MRSSHCKLFTWVPIFVLISVNIYSQLPSRDVFNIIFENDYNDDQPGRYISSDFTKDWNRARFVDASKKIDILTDESNNTPFMRVYFNKGTYGLTGNGCYWNSPLPPSVEIYFSYDIRFKPGFEWVIGGKMPGIVGGHTRAGEVPRPDGGFTARLMWKEFGRAVSYVYHQDQSGRYGDSYFWGNFRFLSGKWYNVTIRLVLNTPGSKNGIMEGFIDGKLWFQKTNFRFRNLESIKIDNMSISSFFGGASADWASRRDEWIDYDNFIAFTYAVKLPNVPMGNKPSLPGKELIHPYRTIPDSEWKKSLNSGNSTFTAISLNWTDYPVPMNYVLERKEEGKSAFIKIDDIPYGITIYIDKNVQPDKTYVYRIKAGSALSNELKVRTKASAIQNTSRAYIQPK